MSKLIAVPINLKEANEFVASFHRHNKPVAGAKDFLLDVQMMNVLLE